MRLPVYLDYNATTPVDPRVLERMLPFYTDQFGNASSKAHPYGWAAQEAVEQVREQLSDLLQADPTEIVFTSGATEALNTAIKGVCEAYSRKGRHIITTQTEHSAVLEPCRALESRGFEITNLPVDRSGALSPDDLEEAIRDDTILVAIMWANNETGVVHPISRLSEIARSKGVLFLTDATQAVGKIPVAVEDVDLLTCSAHKFYGPKGIGALYVRRRQPRVRLIPLLNGGGQERNLRGGTLNVPGIVGMGAAVELIRSGAVVEREHLFGLRELFESGIVSQIQEVVINGKEVDRLPQTSSLTFPGIKAADLLTSARDLAISAGSACASGRGEPSHVLRAMGLSDTEALSTVRISFGRFTTEEEIRHAVDQLVEAVHGLTKNHSTWNA